MKHAKDKARFGVKAKLMSFILPVVAIAFLILSMVAFFVSRASIREKTESLMDAEGTASVNQLRAGRAITSPRWTRRLTAWSISRWTMKRF